ncbi:hypothetical protein KIN20_015557 [Parelaphostrongylus tenuis]|uniref:Uncharacterized protein n=1 Tax=Parelaphostrongylus tenuis TaxID=148309 RepID=A0AAD5QQ02_PARTN|nr:hypothetical protein KIN20_015557 [Parelaphostrongylus tenuis]
MSEFSPDSPSEDDISSRRAPDQVLTDAQKTCKVCGDRANGYNFGVLTCESCKAFFRRNAMREEEIKCPFSNSCGITSASRRFCQGCRLRKCFEVGMRISWLCDRKRRGDTKKVDQINSEATDLYEEVSVPKAYLNELIRKSKRPPRICECTCTCGFYPPNTRLTALEPIKGHQPMTGDPTTSLPPPFMPPKMSSLERARDHIPSSLPGPSTATNANHMSYFTRQADVCFSDPTNRCAQPPSQGLVYVPGIGPNVMFSAFSTVPPTYTQLFSPLSTSGMTAMAPMFSPPQITEPISTSNLKCCPPGYGTTDLTKYAKLPAADMSLVEELIRANEPLKAPLDLCISNELTLMDVVKISEAALKRIVCMARDLSAFQSLEIEDKKNIMKGSCSELLILRGVMAFNPSKNTWNHLFKDFKGMEVKIDVLKSGNETKHYEEHKRFLTEFNYQIQRNECIMLLLMAIVIFRPETPNLQAKQRIQEVQNMYYGVLRRVLECEYSVGEARQVYEMLVKKLEELKHLKEGLVQIYYGFDSRLLDPLIKELFDMM